MTKLPLTSSRLPRLPPPTAARIRTMASASASVSEHLAGAYPKPVSPPYPELSREVELQRALSAEVRSSGFQLASADVIFEDTWFAVVNKPSGIYCDALLSSLASRPGADTVQSDLHMANRLDRDTSGLMVITKSNKVAAKFVKAFTNHKVKKTYLALCIGRAPNWDEIRISSGHGRSKFGAWRVYASSDVGRTLPGGSMVRDMTTSFEVLSINSKGEYKKPSELDAVEIESVVVQQRGVEVDDNEQHLDEVLVRAYPENGRTHQIRLHCQHLGIPLRGDIKYNGVLEWRGLKFDGHALHAESMSFEHPMTKEQVQFHAPVPSWVVEIVGAMN